MSLAAVSLFLATEPKTKAASILSATGASASRSGPASPKVLRTMLHSSSKIGASAFAR
ncbi:hypothetical protein D3C85_552280 [compost metagenome]